MALKKIDHINILTRFASPTLNFYQKFLGFEVTERKTQGQPSVKSYMLEKDEQKIEIFEQISPDINLKTGIKHLAFESGNIEEDFKKFKEKGASILKNKIHKAPGKKFFFVKTPHGDFVEVVQYL